MLGIYILLLLRIVTFIVIILHIKCYVCLFEHPPIRLCFELERKIKSFGIESFTIYHLLSRLMMSLVYFVVTILCSERIHHYVFLEK